ncbi:hypothetical protein CSUI_011007, partial [Cystoisospora suis]
CGFISLPNLRVLRLHFVEVSPNMKLHDLGGLLRGCPHLESLAVHTDSDEDQMILLNRLLLQAFQQLPKVGGDELLHEGS